MEQWKAVLPRKALARKVIREGINGQVVNGSNGADPSTNGSSAHAIPSPDTDLGVRYQANLKCHQKGLNAKDMAGFYSSWSSKYDQDLCPGVYNGPVIAAKEMCDLYPSGRETVRILDVAAGTGLLGEQLHNHGFRNMDALDPAEGMLKISEQKKIYTKLICEFLDEKRLSIAEDTYDCIVVSGGFGESHIPRDALHEIVRLVKPGGLVCIVMRKEYLDYVEEYNENKLENLMEQLQNKGRWTKITRKVVPSYSFNKDGVVYVYRIL